MVVTTAEILARIELLLMVKEFWIQPLLLWFVKFALSQSTLQLNVETYTTETMGAFGIEVGQL